MPTSTTLVLFLVLSATAGACAAAVAQDMAVPAVDDAPTAAQLLVQAQDQSATNPREAVRLLRTVLDDWGQRPVASEKDPNLFVSAGRRAEVMFFGDPALLAAFRREEEAPAREMLAEGQYDRLVATRLATEAGLEAALRVAQSALTRAQFATAASVLARASVHDGLKGAARIHHAAMQATALARLDDVAGARAALERGTQAAAQPDAPAHAAIAIAAARAEVEKAARPPAPAVQASSGGARWGEIWQAPLQGPAFIPRLNLRQGGEDPRDSLVTRSVAMPAADQDRVFADDGSGVRAFDRLSGRPLWSHAVDGGDTTTPTLHYVAVADDSVISFEVQNTATARGAGRVVRTDAATGRVIWEASLDFADGRGPIGNLVPIGEPIVIDGRVVVAARRTTTRQETVSWLFCFDLREPNPPAWASVVSTVGSMMQFGVRSVETPVLAGGGLYVATGTGAVARFDPATGAAVWLRRFNVPIRDVRSRAEQWELSTPAIAGGKVFAITPDGARMVVLDAETGDELTSVPTGPDTPLGSPQYLVGIPGTTRVAAVGERIVAFDAARPDAAAWSWPGADTPFVLGGRVVAAPAGAGRPPSVVVPANNATQVLDAATGQVTLHLEALGNSLLLADQLVTADSFALSSFMPIEEAERLCRARLASDPSADAALSLLQLARQSKRGPVVAEAAREAARRLGIAAEGAPGLIDERDDRRVSAEDLLDLLLQVDAAGFCSGDDARTLERTLDSVATSLGQSQRAALARADRMARRGDALAASKVLAEILFANDTAPLMDVNGVRASLDAHALARLAQVAAKDGAVARAIGAQVGQAVSAAQGAPSAAAALRTAARVANAAGAAEAVAQAVGALRQVDAASAQRLAVECAPRVQPNPPILSGAPSRVVEFPGRLCATSRAVKAPRDAVLTMQASQLVLRKPPEFGPVWKADIGAPDPVVVGVGSQIVVWDERAPGYGEAIAVDAATGDVKWRTTRTSTLMGRLVPGGDESEPQVTIGGGRSAALAQVLPAVCGDTLVLTRRDGTMRAVDAANGTAARWERTGGDIGVAEFAADAATVVIGGSDPAGDAVPRVVAVDAGTGETVLNFELAEGLAPTLSWLRILPGGLLVVGSEDGVQARRLAGGDEDRPMWQVDVAEVQGAEGAWPAGRWLVVLGRFGQLVAVDVATGHVDASAFRSSEITTEPVRSVEVGAGWVAVVRETIAEFFDMDGRFLGRDVTTGDRSIDVAFASRDLLVALDLSGDRGGELGAQQFEVEIVRLDARSGGKAVGAPVALRTVGQRVSSARSVDGWVLVSNGAFVQAVDFRDSAADSR